MQSNAYLNRIATAVPDHEVHQFYLRFGASLLADHPQRLSVFERMTDLVGHRAPLFVLCAGRRPAGRGHRPGRHLRQGLVCRHRKAHGDVRGGRTGARAEGRRSASGRRGPLAHHASDRDDLHRLFGARHRPRAGAAMRPADVGRAHHRRLHGMLRRDQRLEAVAPHRAVRPKGARADRQYRAVHAASQGNHRAGEADFVLPVGRRLRRLAGDGRAARHPARKLSCHRCRRAQRADELAHSRRRLRHGAVRPGSRRDPRDAAQRAARPFSAAGPVDEIDLWAVHPGGRSVLDAVERALGLGPTALGGVARGAAGRTATCRRRRSCS